MMREGKLGRSPSLLTILGMAAIAAGAAPLGARGEGLPSKAGGPSVKLEWSASTDPGPDTYVIWRCAGADCPAPTPPLTAGGRWKEVARVSATSACASTPCSQSIVERESPPVSYSVVAVSGTLASAPSNVMTLDSTSGSAHAQR